MTIDRLRAHWGFTRMPFSKDLAPSMLHTHRSHAEAVARIAWCIDEQAVGVVTGEVGSGKTVAVRAALAGIDASRHTVIYLGNPTVGARGLVVHGDEDLLVTALRNLLENAVAYSPDRTRVVVSTKRLTDGTAELSVADQGIGIPERDLERIFERFYRVDPARSRATGGTGLGLAIVKHVMAAHNGNVMVRSVDGAGSTFTLYIPLGSEHAGSDTA